MDVSRSARLLAIIAAIFVTCLIVGDLIGCKLVDVHMGPLVATLSVGMLTFPVTFVLTDVLNEFYGARVARFITMVAFFVAVAVFGVVMLSVHVPWSAVVSAEGYTGTTPNAFANVFAGSQRLLAASLTAYLVGQLCDIYVFTRLKRLTHSRLLWLRATGSTVVSQLLDTLVVQYLAFAGVVPTGVINRVIASSYVVKFLIALALTPVLYLAHALIEKRFELKPAEVH